MAVTPTQVRVRIVFKQGKNGGGTIEQRSRQRLGKDFATTLFERLTFSAGEEEYKRIRTEISNSFARDAKQELTHIAALYRRHIIGAGSTRNRPSGMLGYALPPSDTPIGDDDGEISIAGSLPDWAPRTAKYLREKRRRGWAAQWFTASGYLSRNLKAQTLLAAFGPIRVSVTRNLSEKPSTVFSAGGNPTARLNVATVRVFALTNITPSMLPALATGDPSTMNSDQGNPGLMNLVGRVDPKLAYRLGRRSSVMEGSRYRPTLEPFLAFYLTRSLPNALALRLQSGALRPKRRVALGGGRS